MYLVELGWVTYSKDGFISSKDATVNVFRTEGEAMEKLDELFHFFYLDGDVFVKTIQSFRIISQRTTGKMIYRGRISWFDIDELKG